MKTALLNIASSLTLAALTLVTSVAAHAAPVTYDWSATATSANAFGVKVGDTITGVLTYDLTGSTKNHGNTMGAPGSGYQYYDTPSVKTTLNMGTYQGTVNLYMMIVNDFQMWGGDEIFFRSNAAPFQSFQMAFVDSSMKSLSSLDLPQAVNLADFNMATFSANDYWTSIDIRGSVSAFAPAAAAAVPEPGSMALFGLALAGLAAASRRRVR